MRIWTVHAYRARSGPAGGRARLPVPVLVPEAFSWTALLFGPLWLLAHRLWREAAVLLGIVLLAAFLLPVALALPVVVAIQILLGLHAQDLRRGALARRGRPVTHVVAEHDADRALARLLDARPELLAPPDRAPPDRAPPDRAPPQDRAPPA